MVGSGATAVTLVPELAKMGAGHVTIVQRSKTYIVDQWRKDWFVRLLLALWVPKAVAAQLGRWRQIWLQVGWYRFCTTFPNAARAVIAAITRSHLGSDKELLSHFEPAYDPWTQRLCMCPDGDFFEAIANGSANVVTGAAAGFSATGLRLITGVDVEADVVVTATGMNLQQNMPMGRIAVAVDGEPYVARDHAVYKSVMLSGVPNFAFSYGYVNISWTLRSDLAATYVCRLLNYMEEREYDQVVATPGPEFQEAASKSPLSSSYVLRSLDKLPKEGAKAPWKTSQNYFDDRAVLTHGPLDDEVVFS